MTTAEPAALRCSGLVRIYRSPTGETHALRGVDAEFASGQLAGVLGPSGCGKSSLLAVLALRERADGGDLQLLGASTSGLSGARLRAVRRRDVSWVSQRPSRGLFPHLTALEQVALAHRRRSGRPGPRADGPDGPFDPLAALARVDLAERARSLPVQLSGGEQQRLAVASALVGGPRVVVADEPTAELDDTSTALVVGALTAAARAGACVVVATHDARLVQGADRVLLMRHGVLATDREAGQEDTAVVDSAGRLQLPVEALELLAGGRARVRVFEDHVRLEPRGARP
ncbi:MAG: hypothetical protein AVDCRST_MAG35-2520 [uncultured Quadrisphaera sp.]|uniref:ABC transporter domain-containing protein n=1 Tax=uncultured Quadrisphaera sp. TaxID=904978 RepID=A0A6J4Q3U4_9ACTN|nr:MAG: hypothetical protein AVDCRST_MAG35-2520 [uncultured Quadrisphaera sp.]